MLYLHKTDFMRDVQNLVSKGFTLYTTGTVAIHKYHAVGLKLSALYNTEMTAQQRWRAKHKGLTTVHLRAFVLNNEEIFFILLTSKGEGLIHQEERLKDALNRHERIQVTGYQLLRMPRKELEPSWTWAMTDDTFKNWRKRVKQAIRWKSQRAINQCVYSLATLPKFRQVRKQGFQLISFAKSEWRRIYKSSQPCPFDSIYIGFYGRFQKPTVIPTAVLPELAHIHCNNVKQHLSKLYEQ